jgi:plastocyanin
MIRFVIFALSALFALSIAACSDDSSDNPVKPPAGSATRKIVQVRNNSFSPKDLTIARGDTVVWFNSGSAGHTTTSGAGCSPNGLWDSGSLGNGESFSVVFSASGVDVTGTVPYYCIPHCDVGMVGTVTVNP